MIYKIYSTSPFHPLHIIKKPHNSQRIMRLMEARAEDGTRTRDPNLGKVMLYQLSYFRIKSFVLEAGLEPAQLQ